MSPDLAVEVLSPSHTAAEMARKRAESFAGGNWVVDPPTRTVAVFAPGTAQEPVLLGTGDTAGAPLARCRPLDPVVAGGSVRVACSAGGGQFAVDVADTGVGIPAGAAGRIFDDFEQADASTTRRFGGLGLGLSISRRLAEVHGGTLTAAGDGPGRGATFRLRLPTLPAAAPPPPQAGPSPRPAGGASGRRILLVEDDPDTLRLLARLLRAHGHTVTPAASAAAALAAAGPAAGAASTCS